MASVFAKDPDGFDPSRILGKHGPGATAETFTSNEKWRFRHWYERLDRVFSASLHASPNFFSWLDMENAPQMIPQSEEAAVRVIFVPKTMKSPRVIAIEPSCMQYMQQGLMRYLTTLTKRDEYTGGHVNFDDQSVNQNLARLASKNRNFATLDMKEASDRVSVAHVEELLAIHPLFKEAVFACRSTHAVVPSGLTVKLRKFASMGSALCFPMEALSFFCSIVAIRLAMRHLPATPSNIREYARDVYVFGDDLIVPNTEAPSIRDGLELMGFKVNGRKSFWTGKFRESCGVDAYDGQDVTPVYCRYAPPCRPAPSSPRSVFNQYRSALASWVALANGLYDRGYWLTAQKVRDHIERELKMPLPTLLPTAGGLGWSSFRKGSSIGRWNRNLHRFEVKTVVPVPEYRNDPLDGYGALHKCLYALEGRSSTSVFEISTSDKEHLTDRKSVV